MMAKKQDRLFRTLKLTYVGSIFLMVSCLPRQVINTPAADATPTSESTPKTSVTAVATATPIRTPTPTASPTMTTSCENGTIEEKVMYQYASPALGQTCIFENQTRQCANGSFSNWSGSFTIVTCLEQRTMYLLANVPYGGSCVSQIQTRSYSNGVAGAWSGTYGFTTCSVALGDPSPPGEASWTRWPISPNISENPGAINTHFVMSGKRIARIDGITYALIATDQNGSEAIFKSTDDGQSWLRWSTQAIYASNGVLLTGPNKTVYYIHNSSGAFYMVKFAHDSVTCPNRVLIKTIPNWATNCGAYNSLGGIVDADGDIFITYNKDDGSTVGNNDGIFMIRSFDSGLTWSNEITIQAVEEGETARSQQMEVSSDNALYVVYNEFEDHYVRLGISNNNGDTWNIVQIAGPESGAHARVYNANVLTVGSNDVYIFAQSYNPAYKGLVVKKSSNSGLTFGQWQLIASEPYSGYGDPSPALAADGTIYVGFRGVHPDLPMNGSPSLRARVAMSTNNGESWSSVSGYFYDSNGVVTERVGTKTCMRYQTWWSYGGPLQWTWMQNINGGVNSPIYYNVNNDVSLAQLPAP
ncbi:MAG: hypothetical protein A2504_12360 [Bdellovibrionales bacterium RIFOXYD12_FULL_39_22]|nr:MAG: hypothetical protein A2385_17895 [Bdellovibrionales bacterium RIFOXYB1_FULL_39_21]OFZ40700.1 MAG: hypothetical protein A2485_03670 [Bdellovibrionales bacterium RIFOXYC12_FULL_39_17]OFZ49741.1 MAG: hypothetical protein A2404_00025 [Bdellovibrionales bacterium RIFOXYC1_FULL_39_130]OFZ71341.1 MAG: hypothetical protein A2451_08675 [Bdellovibrionales bacterium RIFOXYC2_FULL_39_8]OFZ77283.1 MAG: hypothetical protein A2560_14895 [Bdellovibrionales bacterium RIFOXYD1_FULL_39_84]OFZ91822.1 MAG: